MKKFSFAILLTLLSGLGSACLLQARNVVAPQMYMFGFAASFSDSIVHFTDIQAVDSAWVDAKTQFLQGRDNYSIQLREYLANQVKMERRTCVTIYGTKRSKLEKQYIKMKRKYTEKSKSRPFDVRFINQNEFRFQPVNMGDNVTPQ